MRLVVTCWAVTLTLCGYASDDSWEVGRLPLEVGNGIGSQFGNYEMRQAGATRDAVGNDCVIFNWDRPLNRDFAI